MLSVTSPRMRQLQLCLLALVSATVTISAGALERTSLWRQHEIAIDGQDDDWRGSLMPIKGQRFSLGLVNDGEFLYICLPTKDATMRSLIARRGLMVWLDKQNGKKNQFGIHFPIPGPDIQHRAPGGDKAGADPHNHDPLGPQDHVGILGPGLLKAELVPLDQAGGIEARVGVHDDLIVYELKVPLQRSALHPYAPDVKAGDTLRVQLETPATPGGRAPLGYGPGGVAVYGGGNGAPGGTVGVHVGIGGPPIGSAAMLEPLEVPLKVKLAAGPPK